MAGTRGHRGTFDKAVVIGASIGGSCAAAALSPYFETVTVLDRDDLPAEPAKRRGAPHGQQFHTLTVGGRLHMEDLFPGLTEDLRAAGVPYTDPALNTRYASKFGWFARQPSTMRMLQPTRRYLEWYLRKRAQSLPNVEFLPKTTVVDLVTENGWVTGVRAESGDAGEAVEIRGDLIVDVSGRGSRAPEWLTAAGYPAPEETTVNARWGYATTYVQVPPGWDPGYTALYVGPTVSGEGPAATRGAAMWPQEDNLVVVTAQGCAADYPPGDMESFRQYVDSFGAPEFGKFIDEYGTAAPVKAWRNTTNRLRDYAGLAARPEGFIAVGDAVAAFNPIYGQGMPMAAAGARALRDSVAAHKSGGASNLAGFAQQFQRELHAVLMPCWEFSTSSDFNVPGVEVNGVTQENARRPESEYADRVLALATEDPDIALKFMETINLVREIEWMADEALQNRVMANWDHLGSLTRAWR
jgi:2-polyprenyl-6-methoxyphenol hydroxylase-like FAD-dependent oxidoreductase